MIIGADGEHEPLRADALTSRDPETECNSVSRSVFLIPILQRLGGSGIRYVVGKKMRIGQLRALQKEDGDKPVGGQRSQKETQPALPVVNQLASKPPVEAMVRL